MGILNYDWSFESVLPYLPALVSGLWTTITLTLLTIIIGTPLGIAFGLILTSKVPIIRYPMFIFIDVLRSLPILILILWIYYFVPVLLNNPRMSAYSLAAIALILNLAAFISDIVRASIIAFPQGMVDAALACGLSSRSATAKIIIPNITRELLPTFALLYIDMLKLTSLASVISVYELLHSADRIRSVTFRALEVFSIVAIIYLSLVMPFAYFTRKLEKSKYFKRRT